MTKLGFELLYGTSHTDNVFNFNKSVLMLSRVVFLHNRQIIFEIGIASFLSCLRVTTKDKVTSPIYWIAV